MTESAAIGRPAVWCIIANVVQERPYGPGGQQTRRGLKLFSPGAKVFVPDGYEGMGHETVTAVGRTRHGPRFVTVAVATEHLTNWRVKLVYSPAVLERLHDVWLTENRGFSSHGADRTSTAYHDDLQRMAAQFQQRTEATPRPWKSPPAQGDDLNTPGGFMTRLLTTLRNASAGRSNG